MTLDSPDSPDSPYSPGPHIPVLRAADRHRPAGTAVVPDGFPLEGP